MLARRVVAVPLLLAASIAVQCWCVACAVTPAQDSVRLAGMAAQIEREGLARAIVRGSDPPLFPLITCAVARLVDGAWPAAPQRWALAVQGAAAGAVILSVLPVYAIARRLFGATAALLTGLLWCVLPEVSRLGADGLADSTQLALFATAGWCMTRHFAVQHEQNNIAPARRLWLLTAGAGCGLAMLARSESVLLLPAIVAALVANRPRRLSEALFNITAVAAGVAVFWGPYLWLAEASTAPAVADRLLGRLDGVAAAGGFLGTAGDRPVAPNLIDTHLPTAAGPTLVFPHKDASRSIRVRGWLPACSELLRETLQAWCYWVGGLAVWGLWRARQAMPGWFLWLLGSFAALLVASVWTTSARWGYLSTRHLLLSIPLALGAAGWTLTTLLEQASRTVWARGAVAACLLGCLPATVMPRHASRAPHRQAADWLCIHSQNGVRVLDTRGWTGLYSGQSTYRFTAARAALIDPQLAYVVVECKELARHSPRSESLRWTLNRYAEPAATFGDQRNGVVVYRWDAPRFAAASAAKVLGN